MSFEKKILGCPEFVLRKHGGYMENSHKNHWVDTWMYPKSLHPRENNWDNFSSVHWDFRPGNPAWLFQGYSFPPGEFAG